MTVLDEADIDHLSSLGRICTYSAGVVLAVEDESGGDVFLIVSGLVRIVVSPPEGLEMTLATRGPGQLVGELSALDGRPRSASVVAAEQTTVRAIDPVVFRRAVAERASLAGYLVHELVRRLRAADVRTTSRANDDLRTRVTARLVSLADATGWEPGDPPAELVVRQADLASWVGSTREAVARILGDLRRDGLVETGRGSLRINDLDALRRRTAI